MGRPRGAGSIFAAWARVRGLVGQPFCRPWASAARAMAGPSAHRLRRARRTSRRALVSCCSTVLAGTWATMRLGTGADSRRLTHEPCNARRLRGRRWELGAGTARQSHQAQQPQPPRRGLHSKEWSAQEPRALSTVNQSTSAGSGWAAGAATRSPAPAKRTAIARRQRNYHARSLWATLHGLAFHVAHLSSRTWVLPLGAPLIRSPTAKWFWYFDHHPVPDRSFGWVLVAGSALRPRTNWLRWFASGPVS